MLEIKVHQDNKKTLLEILRVENHYLPAVCAGRGTCGKCRVKIVKGEAAVTNSDRSFFSQEEIDAGWRLACKCIPKGDLCIETDTENAEAGFEVLGTFAAEGIAAAESPYMVSADAGNLRVPGDSAEGGHCAGYILGIDIGTTTIAMALQNGVGGQVVEEYLTLNRQRMYGADVVSRIQASVEGKGPELQALIREDLSRGILQVTKQGAYKPKQIVIAANTTMIHLLMGYPCHGLGQYPFTPHHIGDISGSLGEILGGFDGTSDGRSRNPEEMSTAMDELQDVPVHILPGISTFVGADIVADMLVCGMAERSQVSVLIDVGTNGEMAIGNSEKILVTSTAAGPAFEGGNISCGTGSIPGAICGVGLTEGRIDLKTIQNCPPVGICGTGTIEIIYELLQAELMDETGYMDEDEFVLAHTEDGCDISFTQKDVRQLQLAKSAIRAGVETLLLRYGITAAEVDTVYLAGGFGYHINLEKAMGIGLLPEGFRGKIKLLGNGSLQGALQYGRALMRGNEAGKMPENVSHITAEMCGAVGVNGILSLSAEIGLAADIDFNDFYMEYMGF